MSNICELNCQPAKNQLNKLIVPTHKEIAKQSVAYINKFGCPPEYVADILRNIANAQLLFIQNLSLMEIVLVFKKVNNLSLRLHIYLASR